MYEDIEPNYDQDRLLHGMTRSDWLDWITEPQEEDDVNSPTHYKIFPDAEAIDIIEGSLTRREYIGYLKGNALKYRLRAGKKDDAQKDLDKSDWYQGELFAKHEELGNE